MCRGYENSSNSSIFLKKQIHKFTFIIMLMTLILQERVDCDNNKIKWLNLNELKIYQQKENDAELSNDICYDKINKEVLWLLSSLTNNVSEIYNQNNIKSHFSFMAGSNYNELGSYDKCLEKSDMKYFLNRISMHQMNQTVSVFQGSCLPIECKEENSLKSLQMKFTKILNLTENNKLELLDVEILNSKFSKFDSSNIIILLIILIYLLINLGFIQRIIHKYLINKISNIHNNTDLKYIEINEEKEELKNQKLIINKNSVNSSITSDSLYLSDIAVNNKTDKDTPDTNYQEKSERIKKILDLENIKKLEDSFIYNLLQKFNCIYNYNKIFKTEVNENLNNEFKFMDFIRAFLCYYIVILHSVVFIMDTPVKGIDVFIDKVKTFPFQLIVNASFIVDVFFTISAFFLGYFSLSKFKENSSSIKFFFNLIAFRLMRIWPVVVGNFLIFWKLIPILNFFYNGGPIFGLIFQNEFGSCEKQWPYMLSFTTNFTYGVYEKFAPVCLGWYWYLPIDLQMYLIGVLLIILYRKNIKLFNLISSCLILTGLYLEINCLLKLNYGMNVFSQGSIMSNFTDYYIKIYNRCSPFWIGFLFGINYFEFKSKLNQLEKNKDINSNINVARLNETNLENEEREIIMKEFNLIEKFFYKLKLSRKASILSLAFSITSMLFIIFIVYFSYDSNVPDWINFCYNFLSRKIFSLAFILFMFSLLNGHLKSINNFMNSKVFNLPAKLSFAIYLCHPCIIKLSYYSTKSSFYLDFYQIFLYGIGFCVLSSFYAFFLYLFFEAPFMNFKPERKHSISKNNRKLSNEKFEIGKNYFLKNKEKEIMQSI